MKKQESRLNSDIVKLLQKLRDDGSLKQMLKAGVINHFSYLYLDIVEQYDVYWIMGMPKMEIVTRIGEKFGSGYKVLSATVIYNALNSLEYEYRGTSSNKGRPRKVSR